MASQCQRGLRARKEGGAGLNLIEKNQAGSPCTRTRTVLVDNFFFSRADRSLATQVVPHLGLMTLATVLRNDGQAVSIQDPKILFRSGRWLEPTNDFYGSWAEDLLRTDADVFGFTAYGRSLPHVIRVAELIKRSSPHSKIALGGPHPTIVGEHILRRVPAIDAVARYECESVITPLVTTIAAGKDLSGIPNLVIRRNGSAMTTRREHGVPEMDQLPWPALDLYPIEQLRLPELSIEAGRGCPFECTFCSTSEFFQRRYRLKSNTRMISEMETLRQQYGATVFNLNHDLFGLVKSSLLEFCSMVRGRGFVWKCSVRPDTLSGEMVRTLADAGCRHLYLGIESGSPRLQRVIKKRLDLERSKSIVGSIVGENLHCTASFITGFPEETEADQDLTLDLIGELMTIDPQRIHAQLHVLSPEPGSLLTQDRRTIHFDGIGPELDDFLDHAAIAADPELYSVFYHYESITPRPRTVLASAFVTHLIPEIGPALITHMCARFFAGSLARLFRAVVDSAPPHTLKFETVLKSLRDGLRRTVRPFTSEAPYLTDLMRMSSIMQIARSTMEQEVVRAGTTVWLAKFDYDIQVLGQTIIERPTDFISPHLAGRAETWCVFRSTASGQLTSGVIPPEIGRRLNRSRHEFSEPGWIDRRLLRQLRLKRLEL